MGKVMDALKLTLEISLHYLAVTLELQTSSFFTHLAMNENKNHVMILPMITTTSDYYFQERMKHLT